MPGITVVDTEVRVHCGEAGFCGGALLELGLQSAMYKRTAAAGPSNSSQKHRAVKFPFTNDASPLALDDST